MMGAPSRNHLYRRRSQVMIDAGPRNHLYLLGAQVKIRSCPRNQAFSKRRPGNPPRAALLRSGGDSLPRGPGQGRAPVRLKTMGACGGPDGIGPGPRDLLPSFSRLPVQTTGKLKCHNPAQMTNSIRPAPMVKAKRVSDRLRCRSRTASAAIASETG